MYTLRKVCPMYTGRPAVYVIDRADTEDELLESLRRYFLETNEALLLIPDLPDAIREKAEASIDLNDDLTFALTPNGTVWVDGVGPEMDSYTVTKSCGYPDAQADHKARVRKTLADLVANDP